MIRRIAAVVTLVFLALGASASTRTVTIPFAAKPPVTAADFEAGALLSDFTSIKDSAGIQPTEARLLYDSKFLYIGVRCTEPHMSGLVANVKDQDGRVWLDDCVEILLDTANAHHICYHIMVNPIGAVADEVSVDADHSQDAWNSNCRVKAGKTKDAWTLRIAIPFDAMGIKPSPGLVWGLNICRGRPGGNEYSAWSPTPGGFVQPINFGHVVFGDEKGQWDGIRLLSWGTLDGSSAVECLIPGPGTYDISLTGPGTDLQAKVEAPAEETVPARIEYSIPKGSKGRFALTISSQGKEVLRATHPLMALPSSARVWDLKDPLFKELLSKNPPGLQKAGAIYWFHSGNAGELRPFAKEYGVRYSLDEQYKELADCKFLPIYNPFMLDEEHRQQMADKYHFKVLLEPYYTGSAKQGAPTIGGLPFILDPRSEEAYFQTLRDSIQKGRKYIWGIYTYDELHDKAVEQGPDFFSQMKDTYPLMNEIDQRVKKEFGFGKYGIPESPTDPNPFRWIAYRKFVNRELLEWQKEVCDYIKANAPEIKVISMDPVAGHNPFELDAIAPYVDLVTHQTYPSHNPNRQEFGFVTKWAVDLTGKPVWPCTHVENYAYASTAEETRELMSQVMRNGGKGFHLYIPDVRGGRASSGNTFLTKYGSPERFRAITEILSTASTMNEVAIPQDPDCAIFYSEDHYQSFSPNEYYLHNEPEYAYTFLGPVARTWFKFVNDNMVAKGADLSKFKAIFVPAAKYERRSVVEKLVKYVQNGGTLVLGDRDCFSFAPDGSSLNDLRTKLQGPVLGRGKVIHFGDNPFTEKAIADPARKAYFVKLAKNLGLKTGRDIWRFKFPPFKTVYRPDPEGVCLTGNFIKWQEERPVEVKNVSIPGTYTYSLPPDGVPDPGMANLIDRKEAFPTPKTSLRPEDFIAGWKSERPVEVTFDFAQAQPVDRVHLWYSDQLPALTVQGSADGSSWVRLADCPKQPPTEDVLDVELKCEGAGKYRFVRFALGERDAGEPMTLVEAEVWSR